MKILITGIAGFIGHAVARKLSKENHLLTGVDNLNSYYDPLLKKSRLNDLAEISATSFHDIDIADKNAMEALFRDHQFDAVIHLAAQAGVRHSLGNPHAYTQANVEGFLNVLEGCRHHSVRHLVYASSSSVYGTNQKVPFSVEDPVNQPISLYAATKRANELMAQSYAHLYGIPITGLRFFTVYGPWGRPDMAPYKFTKAILYGDPIDVYNNGDMQRDFTYIDDIVEGVTRILKIPPEKTPENPSHKLYNIGRGEPVDLMDFIGAIEKSTGIKANCRFLPMQPGDVPRTWADTSALFKDTGYHPRTSMEEGVENLVKWMKSNYC